MKMKKIKHPSYEITINSVNCQLELWVDDILFFEEKGKDTEEFGSGIGVNIPFNPVLLKNGEHYFVVKILPPYGSDKLKNRTEVKLKIIISDSDSIYYSKAEREKLEDIELLRMETPWGGLDEGINYPFYELKGEFTVDMLPFELVGWSKSVHLGDEDEKKLFQEVFAFYQQLHALMKERNAVKFETLQEEKEQLISKAFYYDYHVDIKKEPMYIAMVEDRKNAFSELFAEEGLELVPLNPAELKLLIQAHGKLVSLVRHDNTPALRFNDPKNGGEVEMEIRLHRKAPGTPLSII